MIAPRFRWGAGAIGIDLGGQELAAVQLAADGCGIERAVRCPRRFGRRECARETERFLRILARRGVRSGPIAVAPPDELVTVAELNLPAVAAGSVVRELVHAQLARMRPAEDDALVCDWWTTDEGAGPTRRSLATAIDETAAESLAEAFEASGADLAAIVPRPIAIAAACRGRSLGRLEVVVDRTGPDGVATVLESGRVSYVRTIAPLAEGRGERDAEAARESGVVGTIGRDAFLRELRLTLGYLVHRHPSAMIRRLLVVGGPEESRSLAAVAQESLGLPTESIGPPAEPSGGPSGVESDGRLLVPYGLARLAGGAS